MKKLLTVIYQNVVELAGYGDQPVSLTFDQWIAARNKVNPIFERLTLADQISIVGSENAVNDYNALETELYETNRFNGVFNTNPLI